MTDAATGDEFERALTKIPDGYSEGTFDGGRWRATVKRSQDGKRTWLYAEDLARGDIVSFNLYHLNATGNTLKPCEMSSEKVRAFVLGFVAENRKIP